MIGYKTVKQVIRIKRTELEFTTHSIYFFDLEKTHGTQNCRNNKKKMRLHYAQIMSRPTLVISPIM